LDIGVKEKGIGNLIFVLLYLLGEQTEFVSFGGSGSTISTFVKGLGGDDQGRRHHLSTASTYAPMIEAEAENEPQSPFIENKGDTPVVELRPAASSGRRNGATFYTNDANIDGFIGSQDKAQMLEGDMQQLKGIETTYKSYEEEQEKRDKKKPDKKPKVKVIHIDHHGDEHHVEDVHGEEDGHHGDAHIDLLHEPHLLPHHPEIDGKKFEKDKDHKNHKASEYDPHKPMLGTLVHTGHQAYDPHHTPIHEVYRPSKLNSHSDEQIWIPHDSNNLHTFEDNQHGQVVAMLDGHHADESHHGLAGYHGNEGYHHEISYMNHHVDDGYRYPTDGHPPPDFHGDGFHGDSFYGNYHHVDNFHHDEHPHVEHPPILNIPHPYVITSNQPMGPEQDHFSKEDSQHPIIHTEAYHLPMVHTVHPEVQHGALYGLPHNMPEAHTPLGPVPTLLHDGHDIHGPPNVHLPVPHHDDEHHDDKKEGKKGKKASKKTNDVHQSNNNIAPDVQAKLKEMLTTELTKKLNELKLLPSKGVSKSITSGNEGESFDFDTGHDFEHQEDESGKGPAKMAQEDYQTPSSKGESGSSDSNEHSGSSNPNANSSVESTSEKSGSSDSKETATSSSFESQDSNSDNKHEAADESFSNEDVSSLQEDTTSGKSAENENKGGSSNPNNNNSDGEESHEQTSDDQDEKIPSASKVKTKNNNNGNTAANNHHEFTEPSSSTDSTDNSEKNSDGNNAFYMNSKDDFDSTESENKEQGNSGSSSKNQENGGKDQAEDLQMLEDTSIHSPSASMEPQKPKVVTGILRSKNDDVNDRCKRYRILKNGKKLKLKFKKKDCIEQVSLFVIPCFFLCVMR